MYPFVALLHSFVIVDTCFSIQGDICIIVHMHYIMYSALDFSLTYSKTSKNQTSVFQNTWLFEIYLGQAGFRE